MKRKDLSIVFAGPFFNFVLAFILALIVMGAKGADVSYVTHIEKNSPAYAAGLREGDHIVKYNGAHATLGREIYLEDYVNPLDGSEMTVTFERNGEKHTIAYKPESENKYMVGMSYSPSDTKAEITQVTRDSAFSKAGVEIGDAVTEIDGTPIKTGEEMSRYLEKHPFGDKPSIQQEVLSTILQEKNNQLAVLSNIVLQKSDMRLQLF